ncbi:MAG: DNA-binding protein [Rhodocyclaceae bacterium]|nr:DNA-binding protein [Rhodocyclaceae bacterium]
MEYDFTLKFRLSDADGDIDDLLERLGAAGCDDALVGTGIQGRIALNFIRSADSANAAMVSALQDVRKALPTAKLIEVGPDFVGLTDVAEVVGVSRQNMRKLMLTHAKTFPPAIHEGSASIWHLALILDWLHAKGSYPIAGNVAEVANAAMQFNIAKEMERVPEAVRMEMRELVA